MYVVLICFMKGIKYNKICVISNGFIAQKTVGSTKNNWK